MFCISGQHPLVRNAPDCGLGSAHIATKSGRGTQFVAFAHRIGSGAWHHPFLPPRKIVVMIVMVIVVSLEC